MTTALERITQLSGLSGVSAAQHLKQIAGAVGIAGALLVAYSGLPTGTAAQHLLADNAAEQAASGGGKGTRGGVEHDALADAARYARRAVDAPATTPVVVAALGQQPQQRGTALDASTAPAIQRAVTPLYTGGANRPTAHLLPAQAAIKQIANDAQPSVRPGADDSAAQRRKNDDELALILILLEATA